MTRNLYITGNRAGTGKSLVTFGLMQVLKTHYDAIGYFKTIAITHKNQIDAYVDLAKKLFGLKPDVQALYGITLEMLEQDQITHGANEYLDTILTRCKALESNYEVMLCDGSDFESQLLVNEFELNITMANTLGCQIVVVIRADTKMAVTLKEISSIVQTLQQYKADILGIIVNRAPAEQERQIRDMLQADYQQYSLLDVIPDNEAIANPTVAEVVSEVDGEFLYGHPEAGRLVCDYTIAARPVQSFLKTRQQRDKMLVITPSDRDDIIMGCLLADQSTRFPKIAGLLMTNYDGLSEASREIIEGLPNTFAIAKTTLNSYQAAQRLIQASYPLWRANNQRVLRFIDYVTHYIDEKTLLIAIVKHHQIKITPQMFIYQLVEQARQNKRHIVLPEGGDVRILKAADYLLRRDVVDLTILGNVKEIHLMAQQEQLDLSRAHIAAPKVDKCYQDYAQHYYELRKHRQVNLDIALDRLQNGNYFGTMMVYEGRADGMVCGAMHTTGETVLPALEIIKTMPSCHRVSSIFLMCLPDRVVVYGDCAINPQPDAQTLAEIAILAADNAKRFGVEPRIAMLSYSSGSSGSGESVKRVREATHLVQSRRPDLLAEGPLQYDAAVDRSVAQKKMPDSKVAGRASVLIFPDLNTGNNTYKAVQRETGAIAIGPVLQGLKKPVNDLSRGCSVTDIINTVVITAIQAQQSHQNHSKG